ncbi:hypothetical protein AcV5_003882 [Taiwanofungus camphoratus]|nr:hypothetical protein AcV5_003882 [Antrodia cinnamomea]
MATIHSRAGRGRGGNVAIWGMAAPAGWVEGRSRICEHRRRKYMGPGTHRRPAWRTHGGHSAGVRPGVLVSPGVRMPTQRQLPGQTGVTP